jgi:IclR family transcriptional regulator, KDG regulon repressor
LTDYTIAVVKNTVDVLESFQHSTTGLTLTEIAEITQLVKNKVFRILYTLEQSQMVYRDVNGKFHLGLRILDLSQNVFSHSLLIDICNSVMDNLLRETQESIFLGVRLETNALCIATRESPRSMRLFARTGIQIPLYTGGIPKVLLANLEQEECEGLLEYFQQTVNDEPVNWGALHEKLTLIRQQGYSVTVDELDIGAHSITGPIFDKQNQIIAAMSIAGPSIRFSEENIQRYINLIIEATNSISVRLGYEKESSAGIKMNHPNLIQN